MNLEYRESTLNTLLTGINAHPLFSPGIESFFAKLNVLLTVHRSIPVQLNQRDALFIQFIKNNGPLYVSSITCSSSGGVTQTALGILRACYVSRLHQFRFSLDAAN
jgi:hypothetical protein